MYDDATGGHQTPEREDASLFLRTDCPDCGRPLANHGLTSAGPGRTRLAPCGFDVAAVTLREIAFVLNDTPDGQPDRRVATDGGSAAAHALEKLADELDRRADQHALRANETHLYSTAFAADLQADTLGDAAALAREFADEKRSDGESDEVTGGESA